MREIADQTIHRVEQLLNEGHSQRKVARITGVSRSTVNRVATGRRPDLAALRRQREEEKEEHVQRCGPICRCRECGYLVEMPCLVCRARKALDETFRKRRCALAVADA